MYRDKKIAKNAQIEEYNKSAHHLNSLAPGDAIRMKLPGQDTWTLGECTKKLSNRSYVVLVQGHTYIRNRRPLRLVYENLPLPDSESKSAATRSWSDVSYNASCRNKNADVRVTIKRRANADTGYTNVWTRHQCAEAHVPGNHQRT